MTQDTPTVEEAFSDGFSFEGNNDPEDTPKMLFVKHEDGTKSIATPEYVIAFAKAYATTYGNERYEEGVKAERDRIVSWAKRERLVENPNKLIPTDIHTHNIGYNEALDKLITTYQTSNH